MKDRDVEEDTKLTPEEYLQLMDSVGYNIEGRTQPGLWGAYSSLFQDIRQIGRSNQEYFVKQFEQDDPYIVAKRIQANRLIEEAWSCFTKRDSEAGWRKEVEYRAFESFDSESVCRRCFKRLSKAKFEARPVDPDAAEELRRRRLRRRLCTCTALQRAGIDNSDRKENVRIFTREIDKNVFHEDITPQMRKRLGRQRPDRVIGLYPTRTFKRLLPSLKKNYSPYKKKDVVYPFIVVEAKAAENNGNASFGSMLRQTAFVVRTCMRLQQNMQAETGREHQCLVWDFLILGEEWRLYAAVPEGDGVRLFDLWHGSMLHEDGAFQLLLIIDYLCDWACDVYRQNILACLAGGRARLKGMRLSPSGTEVSSSQRSDRDMSNLRGISLPLRSSTAPDFGPTATVGDLFAAEVGNSPTHALPDCAVSLMSTTNTVDAHQWRNWEEADPHQYPWATLATIRHSNVVKYSNLQLTLPAGKKELEMCLDAIFPEMRAEEAAGRLLRTMCDDTMTIKTCWNSGTRRMGEETEPDIPVRAFVYAQCALNPESWHVTRRLLLILCCERALQHLAAIAHVALPARVVDDSVDSNVSCHQVLQAVDNLKLCTGGPSAGLAIFRRQLFLRATVNTCGHEELEWVHLSHPPTNGPTTWELGSILPNFSKKQEVMAPILTPYIQAESALQIIPTFHKMTNLAKKEVDIFRFKSPGILIKKPTTWPGKTPEFCLLVTEQNIHFDDKVRLGDMIEEAKRVDEVFGVVKQSAKYGSRDMAFFSQWAKSMKEGAQ
ncbi:hypothetical protein PV08_03620 [Exophiala spinifera]|uniref:PD-(D/E)XK nuclease-like domain-containing protein n=1 Tax=Exophiala spinifera TaxID=91928 RepID=A0A0D1YVK6_9EURO|nr:uncharacterized protein PV08_03620 [Exophiala spinifera]KIW19326.1 hypothetical protein PV08_03620 [Exophiala spinifera]